jgi:Protein of unknown function (DUF2911)
MYLVSLAALAGLVTGRAMPSPEPFQADTACPHRNVPLEGRKSPLDSVTFTLSNQPIKVCYGRPSSSGRTMIGGSNIPYGKLWRTGANEPTIFYAPVPLSVAGIAVGPGVYSLYTVPGRQEWEVIVNKSVSQWGHEKEYTPEVKAQEIGRAKVKAETTEKPLETFTIRAEPQGSKAASLILEWEKTKVRIPIQSKGSG